MRLRKWIAGILTGSMLLAAPMTVMADNPTLNKPYLSLGADLNQEEKKTVLNLLGISESDLNNYTVVEITNAMEHEYLDSYLDASLIGSRALSSVMVKGREDGNGIQVTTNNITYCTVGMYQNALATAGIQNADIKVVGPFKISGTAGLVGAIKAYETMTGETVSELNVETATNELVVTSDLAEAIGNNEKAEELVGFVKNEVLSSDMSKEEVSALIDDAASQMEISLSEEDRAKILSLMDKIDGLDLNVEQLQSQVEGLYERLKELDLNIDLNSPQAQNFFSGLLDKIVDFFNNLFQ